MKIKRINTQTYWSLIFSQMKGKLYTLMLKGEEPEHLQSLSSSHIKALELMELIHRKHMKNCFWTACLVTERTLPTGMKWHSPGNMSIPYLTFGKIKQLISRI